MTIEPGIEYPVQGRFRTSKVPVTAPGKCAVCGHTGDGHRDFVDFGMQLDWYGAVYFCSECITEAAQSIGFIPTIKFVEAQRVYRELASEHAILMQQFNDFRTAVRGIFADCNCADDLDLSVVGGTGSGDAEADEAVTKRRTRNGKSSGSE